MNRYLITCVVLAILLPLFQNLENATAQDFEIVVDYTYDTNNFFASPVRRAALEAAADRYSAIINSTLTAVGPDGTTSGTGPDWRVGFVHPGNGSSFQLSTAASEADDDLFAAGAGAADVYGFPGLNENEWRLFAGGRPMNFPGIGGTGTGINFTTTLADPAGPHHRGVISVTAGDALGDLPAWGGAISFDTGTNWHFDLATPSTVGETDFYSVALHEIGHALGLSSGFNQWESNQTLNNFLGLESVSAYNEDNGTNLTSLSTTSAANFHWADDVFDSVIFDTGNPNYVGTVGAGNLQDLLMEPMIDFNSTVRRFELTNTDVAALRDLGWSTISVPEPLVVLGDVDLNGTVNFLDISAFIAVLASEEFQAEADCNEDNTVSFLDISPFISILSQS